MSTTPAGCRQGEPADYRYSRRPAHPAPLPVSVGGREISRGRCERKQGVGMVGRVLVVEVAFLILHKCLWHLPLTD